MVCKARTSIQICTMWHEWVLHMDHVYLPRVFWCEEVDFIERVCMNGRDECCMNSCNWRKACV
jgi:hypothetical protein